MAWTVMAFSLHGRSMRGDVDLGSHFVMGEPAIFQTQHPVDAGFGKGVTEHIDVARHRLGLGDDAHARIIERETVINVLAGDVEFGRLPNLEGVWSNGPRPLLAEHF